MRLTFLVSGRGKQVLDVSPGLSFRAIRCLLAHVLGVPGPALTFLHMARAVPDGATVASLDLAARAFVAVHVRAVVRRPILARESAPDAAAQPILAVLHCLLRDVTLPIREFLLRNPACLPELMASLARDAGGGAGAPLNPQLLLSLFGITPDEFLDALGRVRAPPAPAPDPVAEFIDAITPDDIRALERVMSADVTLDVALPIFLEQNKDVAATIEQINRMRRDRTGT